jgi:hypothetical protein
VFLLSLGPNLCFLGRLLKQVLLLAQLDVPLLAGVAPFPEEGGQAAGGVPAVNI